MVQVIKHPDTYKCEVCGEVYVDEWRAELCEEFKTITPPFKVGDTIFVQTRYDGILPVEIVDFTKVNYLEWGIERMRSREAYFNLINRENYNIKDYFENTPESVLGDLKQHSYGFKINKHLLIGKDCFTDTITLAELRNNPFTGDVK